MREQSTPVLNKQVEDHAHCFDIDSYELLIDIDSLQDRAHWFGIDSNKLPIDMDSLQDCAHWFGIDSLELVFLLTLIADPR